MSFRLGFETGMDTLHILLLLSYCLQLLWCNMLWKYQCQEMEIGRPRYLFVFILQSCDFYASYWLGFIFVFCLCFCVFLALFFFFCGLFLGQTKIFNSVHGGTKNFRSTWSGKKNLGQKVYTQFGLPFFRVFQFNSVFGKHPLSLFGQFYHKNIGFFFPNKT